MIRAISKFLLRRLGWKVVMECDRLPDKYVLIAMPHTSNWDFPLGILARSAIGWENIKYVGKHTLFRPPLGWIMRWLGGYPVDRSQRSNFVDAVADVFAQESEFAICIAPEGTRKKVTELKTGFYYIALKAQVPIVMGKLDWGRKELIVSRPFTPSGDKEADFEFILSYYQDAKGRHPELGIV